MIWYIYIYDVCMIYIWYDIYIYDIYIYIWYIYIYTYMIYTYIIYIWYIHILYIYIWYIYIIYILYDIYIYRIIYHIYNYICIIFFVNTWLCMHLSIDSMPIWYDPIAETAKHHFVSGRSGPALGRRGVGRWTFGRNFRILMVWIGNWLPKFEMINEKVMMSELPFYPIWSHCQLILYSEGKSEIIRLARTKEYWAGFLVAMQLILRHLVLAVKKNDGWIRLLSLETFNFKLLEQNEIQSLYGHQLRDDSQTLCDRDKHLDYTTHPRVKTFECTS